MFLTNCDLEQQCTICWSLIHQGEERCVIHHDHADRLACILCGAAAERLGWCISV